MLAGFADGKDLMDLMSTTPWLPEFIGYNFESALEASRHSANTMTITLRELLNIFYATIVTVEWHKVVGERVIDRVTRTKITNGILKRGHEMLRSSFAHI